MPSIDIHYHFIPPDDVVSARHFGDLAIGLHKRGWKVRLLGCNRSCRKQGVKFPKKEKIDGVDFQRSWRPDFDQNKSFGRIINASWLFLSWFLRPIWNSPPDVILTGTDPIFSLGSSLSWKWTFPSTKLAHWCFDLYPDALHSEGIVRGEGLIGGFLKQIAILFHSKQDFIADLGECMARRVSKYAPNTFQSTLTPWALVEPPIPPLARQQVREELFGSTDTLGILYSGSFGRAHAFEEFLSLARALRGEPIQFCFAVRGNRANQLKAAMETRDSNIRFAGFAPESELEDRLAAADAHLASLKPEWSGCVVPSKFFGSLAIGRPVLYAGPEDSAIGKAISRNGVGWVVSSSNIDRIAGELVKLSRNRAQLQNLHKHCHEIYQKFYSKEKVLDKWDASLRDLLST